MARSNTGSTSNRFTNAAAPVATTPLTLACWFNPANLTSNMNLIFVSQDPAVSLNEYFGLIWDGANANGQGDNVVLADASNLGVESFGVSPTGGTANAWNHACAVFASGTSRTAYLNGVGGTTNTTSRPTDLVGYTSIGGLLTFSPLNGSIAEVAAWNVALTAAEVLSLAKGFSPLQVRPDNLLRYWPLYGAGTETCQVSGQTLTTVGTMAKAAHVPNVSPPAMPVVGIPGTVGAGGGTGKPVKVWSGSAWVTKTLKVWSGSAWATKPAKIWNGSAWV